METFAEFITEFKKIKESLDNYNLIIIVGDIGTGKTGFVNDYFSKIDNLDIKKVDSTTKKQAMLNYFQYSLSLFSRKILIFDDIKIKKDILVDIAKKIHPTRSKNKFVVILNELRFKIDKYIIHKIPYPTKNEVLHFMNKIDLNRSRRKEKIIDEELRKQILSSVPLSIRRICYSIEDGFFAGEQQKEKKRFNITEMGSFILSFAIAENLTRLKKLNHSLISADKLKYLNNDFYLKFLKIHYPRIEKMRLRYPKQLYNLVKKNKEK